MRVARLLVASLFYFGTTVAAPADVLAGTASKGLSYPEPLTGAAIQQPAEARNAPHACSTTVSITATLSGDAETDFASDAAASPARDEDVAAEDTAAPPAAHERGPREVAMLERPGNRIAKVSPKRPVAHKAEHQLIDWWTSQGQGLNVLFVGQASFGNAIAILTDGSFSDPALANRQITVRTVGGSRVSSKWIVATNRKMLLLHVPPGRYEVAIGAELRDGAERPLGQAARGVVVR